MTVAILDTTLGELLFPSRVNTFLSRPAKWCFATPSDLWSRRPERWRWARRFIPCWRPTSGQKIESKRMRAGIRRTSRRVNPDAVKRQPDNARLRDAIVAGIAVAGAELKSAPI